MKKKKKLKSLHEYSQYMKMSSGYQFIIIIARTCHFYTFILFYFDPCDYPYCPCPCMFLSTFACIFNNELEHLNLSIIAQSIVIIELKIIIVLPMFPLALFE